jgi:hypothetical protein
MTPRQSRFHQSRPQLTEDIGAATTREPNNRMPDDNRRPTGPLHRTSPEERQHRDRGHATDTPRWRDMKRSHAD